MDNEQLKRLKEFQTYLESELFKIQEDRTKLNEKEKALLIKLYETRGQISLLNQVQTVIADIPKNVEPFSTNLDPIIVSDIPVKANNTNPTQPKSTPVSANIGGFDFL